MEAKLFKSHFGRIKCKILPERIPLSVVGFITSSSSIGSRLERAQLVCLSGIAVGGVDKQTPVVLGSVEYKRAREREREREREWGKNNRLQMAGINEYKKFGEMKMDFWPLSLSLSLSIYVSFTHKLTVTLGQCDQIW